MSTTQPTQQPPHPGPVASRRRRGAGRLLATLVACLAVLFAGACQGDDRAAESDAEPASSTTTDDSGTPAERAFAELADLYPALNKPSLTPEQEYGRLLATDEADLAGCAERAETGGSCPKPESLHGDLKKTVNVQLLLDSSGSMAGRVGGQSKIAIARKVMLRFVDSLPDSADVSLRVFGHVGSNSSADRARSCRSSELVLPWVSAGSDRIRSAVRSFGPHGWTPLARSLNASLGDFQSADGANASNFVYVISDGIETCGGNPVAAARRLGNAGIGVDLNIVGFDVDSAAQRQLRQAARVAHGTYTDAADAAALSEAFDAYDWAAWSDYYLCKYNQAYDDYIAIRNAAYDNIICVRNAMYDEWIGVRNASYDLFISRRNSAYDATIDIRNGLNDEDGLSAELRQDVAALVAERYDDVIVDARGRHRYVVEHARQRYRLVLKGANQHRTGLLVRAQKERDRVMAEVEAAERRHS